MCRFLAAAVVLGLGGCGASGDQTCARALVPLYVEPGDAAWDRVLAEGIADRTSVIVNPANGPGTALRADYADRIAQARERGVSVLGYVPTAYGSRPPAEVKTDIAAYQRFYALDGIFLDEAASTPELLPHYRDLHAAVESQAGQTTVLNPGRIPDEGYLEVADVVVVFEGDRGDYAEAPFPAWARREPGRIAHLVHTVGTDDPAAVVRDSLARGAGHVYVTEDGGANPWDTLAGGFEDLAAALGACSG